MNDLLTLHFSNLYIQYTNGMLYFIFNANNEDKDSVLFPKTMFLVFEDSERALFTGFKMGDEINTYVFNIESINIKIQQIEIKLSIEDNDKHINLLNAMNCLYEYDNEFYYYSSSSDNVY